MARYADIKNGFQGVNWDGADPDVIAFRDELAKRFPQLKVTSAVRTGNGVGKSGAGSRHNRGQALDLGDDPEIKKFLYSKEGDKILRNHKLGFLDETLEHNMKKTGATGPHLHIGKDSTLSGNSYHGNTSFKVESHDHDHEGEGGQDIQDPNNLNNAYGQIQGGDPAFLQQVYKEKSDREAELAAQVQAEKESIARQNATQERIKQKMENQVKMMEMIQGHDLETVKRDNPKFEEGGEFQGINDNLQFKIDRLKASMPDFSPQTIENSPAYLELDAVRKEKEQIFATLQLQAKQPITNIITQPDAVSEGTTEGTTEGVKPMSVADKLANKFSEIGLQKHQIAGVLGSLTGESGENLSATAKNPHSGAFGIAQWYRDRLVNLRQFAKNKGRDFKNEDIQIEFLLHELQNTPERASLDALRKAKNVEEATMIWTRKYERPSEREIQDSITRRLNNARTFEKKLS